MNKIVVPVTEYLSCHFLSDLAALTALCYTGCEVHGDFTSNTPSAPCLHVKDIIETAISSSQACVKIGGARCRALISQCKLSRRVCVHGCTLRLDGP